MIPDIAILPMILRGSCSIEDLDLTAARFDDAVFEILQSEYCPVAFFVKDLGSKYVYGNRALTEIFERPASEIIGRSDGELYPDEDEAMAGKDFEAVINGKMIHQHRLRVVNGVPKTIVEILVAKRGPRYEPVGIYGVCFTIDQPGEMQDLSLIDDSEYPSLLMRYTLKERLRAARTGASVLLTGESGSGKDHLARHIHKNSARHDKKFVLVNCSGFTPELMGSELFGHFTGAFTGATDDNPGLVAAAEGGTLFLNEIGEMPVSLQARLLHFLDTHKYRRLGRNTEHSANVRVIAATNQDLDVAITEGRFRRDLFFRLNAFPIEAPPLRERREDIPVLVKQILEKLCQDKGVRQVPEIDTQAMQRLASHEWPGNVRELVNCLERALDLSEGGPITHRLLRIDKPGKLDHKSQKFRGQNGESEPQPTREGMAGLALSKDRFHRLSVQEQCIHIRHLFVDVCGRRAGAVTYIAEVLGTTDETVRKELKAANAGEGEKNRPRKKAREEMIPKIEAYLIQNL